MNKLSLLLATLLACVSLHAQPHKADIDPEAATGLSGIKALQATQFMAATANPHATDAAYAMLSRGGSAVDAAIAAQLVLGLVEPQSSGIGGGAFVLHWDAEQQALSSWDGRETAPMAVDENHFLLPSGKPLPFFNAVIGGYSVGTPGVVALLSELHERHGRLPWRELFVPAITLAEQGFAISPRLHQLLQRMPKVAVNDAIREYFFRDDGSTPKPVGHVLRNSEYARSLHLIAERGADGFYRGELAQEIVQAVQSDTNRKGTLTRQDLAQYRAKQRNPVCGAFRQYRICGMGPPSSGGTTVAAILGVLQHHESKSDETRRLQLFSEASRLAFADRNRYLADSDFVAVPTSGLVDAAYLKQRAQLVSTNKRSHTVSAGTPPGSKQLARVTTASPELPSTSHLSIVDAQGNVVSMTTSIETAFGSRVMAGGFLLNNQLTDFSFTPSKDKQAVANRIQPGKRPRSSMSPTIVFEGDTPRLVIGSPGGARIIDYVARVIWDVLDQGTPLPMAVAAPHVVDMGRNLELETQGFSQATVNALTAMGHSTKEKPLNSGLHAIWIGDESLTGAADPRREGTLRGD